jgi:hypothetical protein
VRAFLGIDDTDVLGHKPGTGRLARDLAAEISTSDFTMAGVVRHQLLVDPRVPYTSHNSPACVIFDLDSADRADAVFEAAAAYVGERAALGSDPGVCLALEDDVDDEVVRWGMRAAAEVLDKTAAYGLADKTGTRLRELGGTGDGVIGALAAVGLTRYGNAGRFLELAAGIRELPDPIDAAALLARGITPISSARNSEPVPPTASIATGDWLRPRLIGGRPVLLVEPIEGGGWHCTDRKKLKPPEESQPES